MSAIELLSLLCNKYYLRTECKHKELHNRHVPQYKSLKGGFLLYIAAKKVE